VKRFDIHCFTITVRNRQPNASVAAHGGTPAVATARTRDLK
jgi:hypothetical protein